MHVLNWIFRKNEENLQMLFDSCRMEDGKISVKLFLEVRSPYDIRQSFKNGYYIYIFFILWFTLFPIKELLKSGIQSSDPRHSALKMQK